MKKPTPEDRERWRRLHEESEAARRQLQAALDRVEARLREHHERAERRRNRFRRLLPFRRAA